MLQQKQQGVPCPSQFSNKLQHAPFSVSKYSEGMVLAINSCQKGLHNPNHLPLLQPAGQKGGQTEQPTKLSNWCTDCKNLEH